MPLIVSALRIELHQNRCLKVVFMYLEKIELVFTYLTFPLKNTKQKKLKFVMLI